MKKLRFTVVPVVLLLSGIFCTPVALSADDKSAPPTSEAKQNPTIEITDEGSVLKYFFSEINLGKDKKDELIKLFKEDGYVFKRTDSTSYSLTPSSDKALFGQTQIDITFLGKNQTLDSYTLLWHFKDRASFDKARVSIENELKKSLGLGVRADSQKVFTSRQKFQNKDRVAFLTWSNYAEFIQVEVILQSVQDYPKTNKKEDLTNELSALIERFPEGTGKFSEVDDFGETIGCRRTATDDTDWQTLSTRLMKNCGNLHIYFEVNPKMKSTFQSIRISPINSADSNNSTYSKILESLFGKPEEIQLPMFNRPSKIYTKDNTQIFLSDLTIQDKPNIDITIKKAPAKSKDTDSKTPVKDGSDKKEASAVKK